jgi:hypothetical protein
MKNKARIFLLLVFAHTLSTWTVLGQRSELLFPIGGAFASVFPEVAGFAFGGQVGFNLVLKESPYKQRLFSFSVPEARIIEDLDLEPDFGASQSPASIPRVALKVHEQSGLVVIYGQHSNGEQKIIAFQSESNGRMRRLWSLSFPSIAFFSADSDLAIRADGSRICWIYYLPGQTNAEANTADQLAIAGPADRRPLLVRSSAAGLKLSEATQARVNSTVTRHLALIRADDGVQLASAELTFASLFASVFFDEANSRVVALATKTVFLFAPNADRLDLASTIDPAISSPEVVGQGVSRDGRFLLAYGGYNPDEANPGGINSYVAYDLEQETAQELHLRELLFPVSNAITFHQGKGFLLAPLTIEFRFTAGAEALVKNVLPREVDVIVLNEDGSLSRVAQVMLPKRSPDSAARNALSSYCNVEVSATGALAFIPSGNGRLFTIDTSNGEIVRDVLINPSGLVSIRLLEPLNRLVSSNFSNRFLLLDIETSPVINGIAVKRQRTIINGESFLNGAHVLLDGVDLGIANRSAETPGAEIIVDRGKKDFPRGQVFTFVIVNPDGLRSKPFAFQR